MPIQKVYTIDLDIDGITVEITYRLTAEPGYAGYIIEHIMLGDTDIAAWETRIETEIHEAVEQDILNNRQEIKR